ncbi:hypothetical protein SAMN04489724_4754 [Algoriphagus locisalis]|uniref:Universal stress protein family protein n=1 Tax=Algoriphagus locisalis TaxID=305507 RepID=A0A1I7E2A0_9BACT|nr:hypothetical protein [Algoriphagus locisalis]SFU18060.1 hypothetical protein SAMN04489724_4754 [Algoriphagus locisalis]
MAKTILIPTDFTVESLNLAKTALENNSNTTEKLRIILVYGQWTSSSITELLFYSKGQILEVLENEEFKCSCKMLLAKYESIIDQMSIDIFSGTNQNAFENYLEGNKVTEAYIPRNYKLKLKNRNSFNLIPFFTKSKTQLFEVNWNTVSLENSENQKNEISSLFFTHGQIAH